MVDTFNQHWLAALSNSMASSPARGGTYENEKAKLLQRGLCKVGWISRNKSRLRSRRSFFLDIPFYRAHRGVLSYGWAFGPPIGMKIGVSGTMHGAWTAKAVYTLDEARPFLSLTWNVRFEPICVAPPILGGST